MSVSFPTNSGVKKLISGSINGKKILKIYSGPDLVFSADTKSTWDKYVEGTLENITAADLAGVTVFGPYAFYNLTSLVSIELPDTMLEPSNWGILKGDYEGQSVVGSTMSNIDLCFEGCDNFTTITVDENNPYLSASDGILYNKSQNTLYYIPKGKTGQYTLPSTITTLADNCGLGCKAAIPDIAYVIDWSAANLLKYLRKPLRFNSITSGRYRTTLADANNSTYVLVYVFSMNSKIVEYPRNNSSTTPTITLAPGTTAIVGRHSVEPFAFAVCTNLQSIRINITAAKKSQGFVAFGKGSFAQCTALQSVTVSFTGSYATSSSVTYTSIPMGCFYNCSSLIMFTQPALASNIQISNVGTCAFYNCSSLTSTRGFISTLSETCTIGDYAFYGCSSMTALNYAGTMEQWNALSKGTDWNTNSGITTIHCSDGDVTL